MASDKQEAKGEGGRKERGQPARDSWLANVPVSGFQFSPIISSRLESRQPSFHYYILFLLSHPSFVSFLSRYLPSPPREKTYQTFRPNGSPITSTERKRIRANRAEGKERREGKRSKWNPIPRIYKGCHACIRATP